MYRRRLRVPSVVVALCVVLVPGLARAAADRPCEVLTAAADLYRHAARSSPSGAGSSDGQRRNFVTAHGQFVTALDGAGVRAVFSEEERRKLAQVADILNPAGRNAGSGVEVPGKTAVKSLIRLQKKYGCTPLLTPVTAGDLSTSGREGDAGRGPERTTWMEATLLASTPVAPVMGGFLLLVAAGVALWLYRRRVRRFERKLCRTPVLLKYGDECTMSHVRDISRGGAMLERPDRDIPAQGLELYLCGHVIAARIAWRNHLYLGAGVRCACARCG